MLAVEYGNDQRVVSGLGGVASTDGCPAESHGPRSAAAKTERRSEHAKGSRLLRGIHPFEQMMQVNHRSIAGNLATASTIAFQYGDAPGWHSGTYAARVAFVL